MMEHAEIEQRFKAALEQAGLIKQAESIELTAVPEDDAIVTEEEEIVGHDREIVRVDSRPFPEPTFSNLFEHPDAHPYVLDLALLKKYGPEWFEWERETLERRVPMDFRTVRISDLNFEKLQAVKTLHYVDGFWQSWQVFVVCTMALNGLFPDFQIMQVPTAVQCAIAVDTANRVRSDVTWTDELKKYVGAVCKFDGIFCPVEPLDFAEVDADAYPVDCEEVRRLWPDVRRIGKAPVEESVTAEQLRRMLLIHEAVQEDHERLRNQLPLLLHG